MATITINIDTDEENRIFQAYAAYYNYVEFVYDKKTNEIQPNPMNKRQFFKRSLRNHIAEAVRAWEIEDDLKNVKVTVT